MTNSKCLLPRFYLRAITQCDFITQYIHIKYKIDRYITRAVFATAQRQGIKTATKWLLTVYVVVHNVHRQLQSKFDSI